MKAVLLSALLVVATFAAGQSAASPQSVSATVDREVTTIENLVIGAAEAMPESDFNFSPETLKIQKSDYQGVRNFATELKHIGASNYFLWAPVTGDKLPDDLGNGNGPEKLKSKAEIIQFVKDSFALGHKAAASLTPENMLQVPSGSKSCRLYLATFAVAHAYDHYGQMVEYLRMNGIVPLASRQKSD
jgi:DinB superfamily